MVEEEEGDQDVIQLMVLASSLREAQVEEEVVVVYWSRASLELFPPLLSLNLKKWENWVDFKPVLVTLPEDDVWFQYLIFHLPISNFLAFLWFCQCLVFQPALSFLSFYYDTFHSDVPHKLVSHVMHSHKAHSKKPPDLSSQHSDQPL